jgi:hypothetical protein
MSDYLEVEVRKALFRTSTVTVRANSTAYSAGDRVMLGTSDLSVYECITGGTTAGAPPAFNTSLGQTTTDGAVTWLTLKQGLPKRPVYIGLFTTNPSTGSEAAGAGTEVSGGSYARVQVDPSDSNWTGTSGTDGLTDNAAAINFPTPSANWGTITGVGVFDRATGGNLMVWGALAQNKTVNNGDPGPSISIGALDITFA